MSLEGAHTTKENGEALERYRRHVFVGAASLAVYYALMLNECRGGGILPRIWFGVAAGNEGLLRVNSRRFRESR